VARFLNGIEMGGDLISCIVFKRDLNIAHDIELHHDLAAYKNEVRHFFQFRIINFLRSFQMKNGEKNKILKYPSQSSVLTREVRGSHFLSFSTCSHPSVCRPFRASERRTCPYSTR